MKRFIDIYIPTEVCNFSCAYCYVSQEGYASNKIAPIGHSPAEIRKALSVKRLGGQCFLNMCGGGETLLGEDFLPVVKELLEEGHFIQIVTNGTLTKRFREIGEWELGLRKKLFFKCSFHFMELKKRDMLNVFFDNINYIKDMGSSFTLELMPYDDLVPYIDEIKTITMNEVGAYPHLTVGRDNTTEGLELLSKFSKEEYNNIWSVFNSEMFDFKMEYFGKEPKGFCYAGEWSCSLRLDTGDLFKCNGLEKIDNIYENVDAQIRFSPVGYDCPHGHCWNCHAYITLGVFPEVQAPSYAKMRDRICEDGSHWLNEELQNRFSEKLYDDNDVFSKTEMTLYAQKQMFCKKYTQVKEEKAILEKKLAAKEKELVEYVDWVNNLQKQVDDRLKELEIYKDWVSNLQGQIRELKGE